MLEIKLATVTDMSWMKTETAVPPLALGVMFFLPAQSTAPWQCQSLSTFDLLAAYKFQKPLSLFSEITQTKENKKYLGS